MRSTKIKKNFCSYWLWIYMLHYMVILRSQNKITDFLMILAWLSRFNTSVTLLHMVKSVLWEHYNPVCGSNIYFSIGLFPDSNVMVGPAAFSGPPHGCPTDSRWPISFASVRQPVVHQWQMPHSDCRLNVAGGPPVAFLPLIATGGPLDWSAEHGQERDTFVDWVRIVTRSL